MQFRSAVSQDLPTLVAMLADDPLGRQREDPGNRKAYEEAFQALDRDPNHCLLLAVEGPQILGFLQLSYLPGLTYQGGWRAQVEGVRVSSSHRSQGIGRSLVEHAIALARQKGCRLIQLTTDQSRPDALRFYEKLGFQATHLGLKRDLAF
ncbi:GNAT family N-acetyltransferase [bacterium SCN 62-11]|nr:MAG: GNAT family N-acetyltransferase [bacterium SCN 62-11]